MNTVTRQDIINIVQQMRDNIVDRVATKADTQYIVTMVNQRCTKADIQAMLDQYTQKMLAVSREQQSTLRTLIEQANRLTNTISSLDYRVQAIENNISERAGTNEQDYFELQRKIFDKMHSPAQS